MASIWPLKKIIDPIVCVIFRHKSSHLVSQFPSLHKSVSTPSIVVDSGKKKKHGRDLPEPTHVFLQRLIADHE